jgi:hypothetical protein
MFFICFNGTDGSARFHSIRVESAGSRRVAARTWEMAYPFATRSEAESFLASEGDGFPASTVMDRDEASARMAMDD